MPECECCHLEQPTTKKYPGLGYWCDPCMNEGCFADDQDAQNPSGPTPTYERTRAVHERLKAERIDGADS